MLTLLILYSFFTYPENEEREWNVIIIYEERKTIKGTKKIYIFNEF